MDHAFPDPVPNMPERTTQNAQVPTFSFLTTIGHHTGHLFFPRAIDHAGSATLYIGESSEKKTLLDGYFNQTF